MTLRILFPIKYAQTEDSEESLLEEYRKQQEEDAIAAEEAKKRFRYEKFQPGTHRGISAVFQPEETEQGWEPGTMSQVSFPIFEYPELMADPTLIETEPEVTLVHAGPPASKKSKSYEHYQAMAERFRQKAAESIKINGEEIPEEYKVDIPDVLDVFSESHKAGEAGSWLGLAFGGANKSKSGSRLYSYLHPSLLSPELLINRDLYKKIINAHKETPIKNLNIFMNIMSLLGRYAQVGNKLKQNPDLNDRDELFNFFSSFKEETPEEIVMVEIQKQKNPNYRYTFNSEIFNKLYSFLEERCNMLYDKDQDLRNLAQITGASQKNINSSGSVTEANSFAINNTFRKILSGYYNLSKNISKDPNEIVSSLTSYITASLSGDLKKYYRAQISSEVGTEADMVFEDSFGDVSKGLEDQIADPNQNVEEEVTERLYKQSIEYKQALKDTEEYENALENEDDEEINKNVLDPDVNIRKKQNIARKSVLDLINTLANQYGISDILGQWDKDFKEFLINNQVYMSSKITKALPNLLESIDFKNGIISDEALPCPNCGKSFIKETNNQGQERLESALVPIDKNKRNFKCRNCGYKTARPNDLANYLSIPLLAFLESKKQQYLSDDGKLIPGNTSEERLERKIDIVEEIDQLMKLNHLRVIVRGPGRYGKGIPGREPVLIYKNGKMFLQNARLSNPDINRLLSFSELNEMPLSSFLAGVGFPVGGFQVGYDRRSGSKAVPFGSSSMDITPQVFTDRNEILNIMMSQEILPILARDENIQRQFGDLKPYEISDIDKAGNMKSQYLIPVINNILRALDDMKQRNDLISGTNQVQSYTELLQVCNPVLLKETINKLAMAYNKTIPGNNLPLPEDELYHLLTRSAHVLDTIASLKDEDINNLSMSQLLEEDPAAKTDPRYHVYENIKQFTEDEPPSKQQPISDYSAMLENIEGQTEKLSEQEQPIQNVMSFVRTHEEELIAEGLRLPKDAKDKEAINAIVIFLKEKGLEIDSDIIQAALIRVGNMYDKTTKIYELFKKGNVPNNSGMVDLSDVVNNKLIDQISKVLLERSTHKMGATYSAIESSPLIRALYLTSRSYTNFSITDFLQILLVSSSGMFGIAENYEKPEIPFMQDIETGEQIRFNPPTADSAQKASGKGQAFDSVYREIALGKPEEKEPQFPIMRPRFVNVKRPEDPYHVANQDLGNYMLFADQFSAEAIANNPRYSYYLQELSKKEEFSGMEPIEIINALKEEINNIIKTLYMDPGSELFKNDPITSLRAITSFFVPSDLIDMCSDVWARKIQFMPKEERNRGTVQNPFYQAASILFDIKGLIESGETSNISQIIINKHKLIPENNEEIEFFNYINNLLNNIIKDIFTGKGCASRALNIIGNRNNLKYLSTTYQPTRTTYKTRSTLSNILSDVNTLIKLASKQVNNDIFEDLYDLSNMIKEKLYEEI